MNTKAEQFFREIKGKRIAFCGVGVSNTPLIEMFLKKGAVITVCDKRSREQLGEICEIFEAMGAALHLGEDYLKNLDVDIIFRTPGMRFYLPELNQARANGVTVTSEMEVFFDLCPCKIFAVTGSDGKTTTTTIISEMLKKQGFRVHLGGNIGRALLPIIEEISPEDYAVVELSSFQLISMRKSPDVAVVTNVAPNHLDMHKDMQEYVDSKKNLIWHQGAFSRTVLNFDNDITKDMAKETRGETLFFSRKNGPLSGAYVDENKNLVMQYRDEKFKIVPRDEIKICGDHNVENYLAAITAVWGYVSPENMRWVAQNFGGVEHRIEFVREIDGVKWYNDSIATNPTRTIAGLNCFDRKVILIAGGYDKKIPFEPLAPVVNEKVKCIILMGATAEKLEKVIREAENFKPEQLKILHADSMEEAVRLAKENAEQGDIVSLSPACASFDKYRNFELRGKHFKDLVNNL